MTTTVDNNDSANIDNNEDNNNDVDNDTCGGGG